MKKNHILSRKFVFFKCFFLKNFKNSDLLSFLIPKKYKTAVSKTCPNGISSTTSTPF